jgi:diguanylate cyclase (GGDEF)-like protein
MKCLAPDDAWLKRPADAQRLAEMAGQEKAYAAEQSISYVRAAVIAVNVASYPFIRERPGVIQPLAIAIIALALAYALFVVTFRPYKRYPALTTSYFTAMADAGLIALWLVATGGLDSPFYALWFPSLAATMFRFDFRRSMITALAYAVLYLGLVAGLHQLAGHEVDVFIRVSYIIFTAILGGLLGRELLRHIYTGVELGERLRAGKQIEQALAFQAVHDSLTGLPNRALLADRLDQAIRAASRDQAAIGLLYADMDGFKEVNDTLGHETGDWLLVAVGERLRQELRQVDTVGRMGGDEFAVVLPGVGSEAQTSETAKRLLMAVNQPFDIDGHSIRLGMSIGVACYPRHGSDGPTLIRHADAAMYDAKRSHAGLSVYQGAASTRHETQH